MRPSRFRNREWTSRAILATKGLDRPAMSNARDDPRMPNGPPSTGRPVPPSIRTRRTPAWTARRIRFRKHPDRPRAQEQRLDDLRARPPERPAAREALLAERVLTREP